MKVDPVEPIVPIEKWLRSPHYNGPEAIGLRPYWYDRLVEYFKGNRRKFIFTGSARSGKTFATVILFKRIIYEVGVYYNPATGFNGFPLLFDLSETTLPKLVFLSLTSTKADTTGVDRIIRSIDKTPYFQQFGRRRSRTNAMVSFPWVQVLSGSDVSHITGEDTLGVVLDEASLRHVSRDSVLRVSQELFLEMRMRSVNTFSVKGVWAGFSGLVSTAGIATSFTDLEVQRAKRNSTDTFLVEAAVYDVNPEGYSKDRFTVYPGDGNIPAFIVDEVSESIQAMVNASGQAVSEFIASHESLLVHPPESLRPFYQENIDYALMNNSGVTRLGSFLFFSNRGVIANMFNESLSDPVPLHVRASTNGLLFLGLYDSMLIEEILNEDRLYQYYEGEPVYCGYDISRVNDHTGFAALYLSDSRKKIEALLLTGVYHDRTKPGNEIDQVKLVAIVTCLYRLGAAIVKVTADGFSSDYVIQRCRLLLGQQGAERFSVDKNPAASIMVQNYAKLGLYNLYPSPLFKYELENLIYDKVSGKVDHPPNMDASNPMYFKDIMDAVTQATVSLSIGEDLSYESLAINGFIADVKRALGKEVLPEDSDDFSTDPDIEGEDFYGDISMESEPDGESESTYLDPELDRYPGKDPLARYESEVVAFYRSAYKSSW